MLKNTFCHVPGIGSKTENTLWSTGVQSWDELLQAERIGLSAKRTQETKTFLELSKEKLEDKNARFFADLLSPNELWRLYPEFKDSVAFVDIETTGLDSWKEHITTITLYDGKMIACYIWDVNLDEFKSDIENYKVIVTYNGRGFDIPFIRAQLEIPMNHAHIDLRYLLNSLDCKKGLKGCIKKLGLNKKIFAGKNGYFAMMLWVDFIRSDNEKALETLLAYNIRDTIILEALMVVAYNMKLERMPFSLAQQLPVPDLPEIPFDADADMVKRIN